MTPVYQTVFAPAQAGNCIAACLASMFELDLADVPNFAEIEGNVDPLTGRAPWMEAVDDWCNDQGVDMRVWWNHRPFRDLNTYQHAVALIDSPRGPWKHCVIIDSTGALAHDPHPASELTIGKPLKVKVHELWFFADRNKEAQ